MVLLTINGEKGMRGTVELTANGWLWHITSPVILDIAYGGSVGTPATYVDINGKDQMAIIQMGGAGVVQVALDDNYSGGLAEKWVNLTDVDIISQVSGYTVQLRYPKASSGALGVIALLGLTVLGIIMLKKGNK